MVDELDKAGCKVGKIVPHGPDPNMRVAKNLGTPAAGGNRRSTKHVNKRMADARPDRG